MERIIDVTAARRQFGTLLDEVFHKGDVVTIERKGKPLAKIVPLDNAGSPSLGGSSINPKQKKMLDELKSLPRIGIEQNPVELLRSMRKQKRIEANIIYGK